MAAQTPVGNSAGQNANLKQNIRWPVDPLPLQNRSQMALALPLLPPEPGFTKRNISSAGLTFWNVARFWRLECIQHGNYYLSNKETKPILGQDWKTIATSWNQLCHNVGYARSFFCDIMRCNESNPQRSPWFVGIYPSDSIRFLRKTTHNLHTFAGWNKHLKMSVELQQTYHFHFTPKKKPHLATLASGNVLEDEFPTAKVSRISAWGNLHVAYIDTLELPCCRHLPLGDMTSRLPRRVDAKTSNSRSKPITALLKTSK